MWFNKKQDNCQLNGSLHDCDLILQLRDKQKELKDCYKEYKEISKKMKVFPEYLFNDYYDRKCCVGEESYGEQFLNRFLGSGYEYFPYVLIRAIDNRQQISNLESEIKQIKNKLEIT